MKKRIGYIKRIGCFIACIGVLTVFAVAVFNVKEGNRAEEKMQLEEAIRRSVVTYYATEGVYPPDFAYVKEKYGILVDESRYVVVYDAFAENLMPDITVLERDYEKGN